MTLKWSNKHPTVPGWYWIMETTDTKKIKRKGYQKIIFTKKIVQIRKYTGTLCIQNWPIPKSSNLRKVMWAGPIPEPLHTQGKRIIKRREKK